MEEQPDWLVQAIVILIAHGIGAGKRNFLEQAFSWASLLANVCSAQSGPGYKLTALDPTTSQSSRTQ